MSKVHSFFVSVITIFLNVLQPYCINMVASHIGRDLYFIINNDYLSFHIFTFIFGFIILLLLISFQTFFVSPSLTFRPQVTHIMYSRFSLLYHLSYVLIFFLATLGGMTKGYVGTILSYITIFPGVCIIYISFRQHLWADMRSMYMSEAFSIVFCISSILLPTLSHFNILGNEIIILVFISLVSIFIFIFEKLSEKHKHNSLELLNKVAEDESLVDTLSYEKIVALLRYGFDNGHPLCHTWKLFELALDKYNNDYGIVLMYARYAAIYSEETTALHIVTRLLKRMKHGSIELKHVLFQVKSLLQHRERGLSKSLKKTLMKIQDKTEKCRGLMRYTWECVIRGNVVELENLSTQLKKNEEEILREYNQLCLVYPNNPYATSAFSAYLLDIMCNEKEANEKQKIYRLLRSGAWTRTERSYYFAIRHISTLLTEEQHAAMTQPEKSNVNENHSYASSVAAIGMIGDLNEGQDEIKTQKRYIESMVNSVKLPTTRYGPALLIFSIALLLPTIIIPEMIINYIDLNNFEKSLNIIKYASLINLYMSHIAFHTFQYGMSSLNYTSTLQDKWDLIFRKDSVKHLFKDKEPSFNLVSDRQELLDCVEYLRIMLNYFNNEVPHFATNDNFEEPLNFIFNNKISYRNYNDTNTYSIMYASMEYVLTFTQGLAIQVATKSDPQSILNSTGFWSIIKNAPVFYDQLDKFEDILIESIQKIFNSNINKIEIISLGSLIPGFFIALGLVIFLTIRIEKEKKLLFTSFKAIPKSAVSAIVQQLNAQSGKEEHESEQAATPTSAQEENALRVLSTTVDHGFGWIGRSWKIIVILFIFSSLSIASIVIMSIIPKNAIEAFIQYTPLYHDISTLHNQFIQILLLLNRIGLACNSSSEDYQYNFFPSEDYPDNYEESLDKVETLLTYISDSAHILRFGSDSSSSSGVSVVGDSLIDLLSNRNQLNVTVADDDIVILEICSYDTSLEFANRMFTTMTINLHQNFGYYPLNNDYINLMIIWLLDSSYMKYVAPSFDALDNEILATSNLHRSSEFLLPMILFVIGMIICGIALIPIYQHISETAQWTLRLLLFCDPNVVLQSKAILKILSNDFSGNEADETEEKASFYESFVSHLFDGVIFMSNDLIIRSANNSVASIIGQSPQSIIGLSLKDLFTSPPGQEATLRSFYQAVDAIMSCMRSPSIETEVVVMKGKEPATLFLSMMAISATGEVQTKPVNSEGLAILVLTLKDTTSAFVARSLLQEENAKNENLLSLILPPIIVEKLQRGEHNISFSVMSASIVFMDIISFTPWCNSNKASYVMSTLNQLFLLFDNSLKKLDKMTKIKCVGDCYMCAGGIFDEVNQPAEHARQAITFGLESIKNVKHLNEELHETFRIRVGCNTGGPLVAGVLGIEKPIFDILGPDINLGIRLEQSATPMQVCIPQHVYELVYGDYFVIKEKGDLEVKGKTYHTYNVSGYAHHHNH